MTKKDCIDLYLNLNKLGHLKGVKFAYFVSRNIGLLKTEIDSLDKATEPSKEYKEFDEKRLAIVKKYAKKDDKGEAIVKNNNYEMEDQVSFDKEFDVLKEENKELWESRLKQLEEYKELLETKTSIDLHKISLNDVPNDITVNQMYTIQSLVEDAVLSPFNK